MKETTPQREQRRAVSHKLTKLINNADSYPNVREAVLTALQKLDQRIRELNSTTEGSIAHRHMLRTGPRFVRFYLKGGNAFKARLHEDEFPLNKGDSDWDTQIVVDPWLPAPVQDAFYAEIEEIVVEELRQAGIEVAIALGRDFQHRAPEDIELLQLREVFIDPPGGGDNPPSPGRHFEISRDKRQSLRQVFDRDRLGLWSNDYRPLANQLTETTNGIDTPYSIPAPSILLNDAIKPFILYRLGYTWHFEPTEQVLSNNPQNRDNQGEIKQTTALRTILMELIDVTLPRRNTPEAVAVWADLENEPLVADPRMRNLPLPTLEYHLRENLTMLCEIADGSSRHSDKKGVREQRIREIYNHYTSLDQQQGTNVHRSKFRSLLNAMAGETLNLPDYDVATALTALEYSVARRTVNAPTDVIHDLLGKVAETTRQRVRQARKNETPDADVHKMLARVSKSFGCKTILTWAFSDDLALIETLAQNSYISLQRLHFTGVDMAVVVRVSYLTLLGLDLVHLARSLGEQVRIEVQPHNTVRQSGISYEATLAVYKGDSLRAFITFTTADIAAAPFVTAPTDDATVYASLQDMYGQRKAAAALTESYVVRTRLSQQHAAVRQLLPVFQT
ncbi:hypothetical protein [Xanthomonas cannabis]|uniref:hypothetical protein n=1 Tax=Xanthomonas cannabis TaxID=1885674 RepID=UPI0033A2CCC1